MPNCNAVVYHGVQRRDMQSEVMALPSRGMVKLHDAVQHEAVQGNANWG